VNDNIKTIISAITLLVMLGGMIFTAGEMWARINENTTAIAERKLTGKTVNEHSQDIIELQTKIEYYGKTHKFFLDNSNKQDETIENIRTRIRELEKK